MAKSTLYSSAQGVARITLNRPETYNALSSELMHELLVQLQQVHQDKAVKVLIIDGAGRGFCGGHDLREIQSLKNHDEHEALFNLCSQLMLQIQSLRQPVIACVRGVATAAGCQLVASCDLGIAADTAKFATPGVNLGLFCSTPMVALTRAINPKHALQMLLSGEMIDAARACELGLINSCVPESELAGQTEDLAAKIVDKSATILALGKQAFYRQLGLNTAEAYAHCSRVMADNLKLPDAAEGIGAFLEKRSPDWQD